MNIKISREEHIFLQAKVLSKFLIGSRMYGNHRNDSDYDYLCVYEHIDEDQILYEASLGINHQFLYDDVKQNTQYIYTTPTQFAFNLLSGDSTINTEIAMYSPDFAHIEDVFSYKIINAFLGFAKRDIKQYKKKNRAGHAFRCIKTARAIMCGQKPQLENVIGTYRDSKEAQKELDAAKLRLSKMLENGEIDLYPDSYLSSSSNSLIKKLCNSKNVREFKYD